MSPSLYKICIDKIENGRVYIRIHIIHPDVGEIPQTKTFALNIILDCWRRMLGRHFFPEESTLPLSPEQARQQADQSPYHAEFAELEKLSFGYKKYISAQEYQQLEETRLYQGERVMSYGSVREDDGMRYYINMSDDFPTFKSQAERYIGTLYPIQQQGFEQVGKVTDPETWAELNDEPYPWNNIPRAEWSFEVTDPGLVNFMVVGTEWLTIVWR
ncbi:MAG: hypothetical protein HC880_05540 [Bacteroidia bacterium]|nr:hypothetical protein [Bacteroidia bacterium]